MILQADLENVWGTYYFAVINRTEISQELTTPVMLPLESLEAKAQEGLTPEELTRDVQGSYQVKKTYKKGMSLVGIGFRCKIPPGKGVATFHITPHFAIGEWSIAVPNPSSLLVKAPGMEPGLPDMLTGSPYLGIIRRQPFAAGDTLEVTLSGLPKGRGALWTSGLGFLGVLFLGSAGWVFLSRRRKHRDH